MHIFNSIFKKIDNLISSGEFLINELNLLTIIFPTKRSIREFHEQFKKYFSEKYDFFPYPKCISVKNIPGSLTNQERFSVCWMLLAQYFPDLSKSKLIGYIDDCLDFLDLYYYSGIGKESFSNYSAVFKEADFLEKFLNGYEFLLNTIGKKDPIVENAEYLDKILSYSSVKKIFWVGFRNPFKIFKNLMDKYSSKSIFIYNEMENHKNIELLEVANIYDESKIISSLCEKFLSQNKTVMIISNDKHTIKNISINLSGRGVFIDSSVNKNFWDTFIGEFFKSLFDFLCVSDVSNFLILLSSNCIDLSDISKIAEFVKKNNLVKVKFKDIVDNCDFLDIISDSDIIKIKEVSKFFLILNKNFSYNSWVNSFKCLVNLIVNNKHIKIFDNIFCYIENCNNLISEDLSFCEFKEICLKYLSYYEYEMFDQDYTNRLRSFGFLESRLLNSDITIIASCTDNNFPVKKKENFFISESFKKVLGLNFDDDLINDFFDLISNTTEKIFITKIYDVGFNTKFIYDIEKKLGGLNRNTNIYNEYLCNEANIRRMYLNHKNSKKPSLPAPNPLQKIRPKRFSCTDIEYLVKNPYAIYVKYILKLKEINYLRDNVNILKGNIIHKILESMIKSKKFSISRDVYSNFWAFSIEHIMKWVTIAVENREVQKYFTEIYGEINFCGFQIFGIADRIDLLHDKSVIIVDYKTGVVPSKKSVLNFEKPQLVTESIILRQGGFYGIDIENLSGLEFWKIGKKCAITKIELKEPFIECEKKLKDLLNKYQKDPYKAYIRKSQYMRDESWYHLSRAIEII